MGIEERLHVLEEEHQLVRGELKQTLVNVRDFLLELNLPALQEEEQREIHEHNESHGGEGNKPGQGQPNQPEPMQSPMPAPAAAPASSFAPPSPQPMTQSAPPSISMVNKIGDGGPPPMSSFGSDDFFSEDEFTSPGSETPPLESPIQEPVAPERSDLPEAPVSSEEPEWIPPEEAGYEDEPVQPVPEQGLYEDDHREDEPFAEEVKPEEPPVVPKYEPRMKTVAERSSQINLLTNLIRWVTVARKEIGPEYLPAFLDVYGIGDVVPDELRQTILYLSETMAPKAKTPQMELANSMEAVTETETGDETAPRKELPATAPQLAAGPVIEPNGEVWNRMILELHGILRCSDVRFEESQLPWKRTIEMKEGPAPVDAEEVAAIVQQEAAAEVPQEQLPDEDPLASGPLPEEEPEACSEELEEMPRPKNGRNRKNGRKKASPSEPIGARLRLVLPVGDDQETEIDIGEFNLNLNRKNLD